MSSTLAKPGSRDARHRFTVDEYQRMAAAGIFSTDERVELLNGDVVMMTPIGPEHGGRTKRLLRLLNRLVGDRAIVCVQDPLSLDEHSQPEPDLMLLRPREDFYTQSHPTAADVLLLIEIADSSLARDRDVKLPLYASAGVREVWVVDIHGRVLTIHTRPSASGYASCRTVAKLDEPFGPGAFADVALTLGDILG